MGGIDMEYFKKHGYYKIDVGTADTRAPHAEGKFPTPSGKVEFLLHDAKNFVAGPFRAMYEGEQAGEAVDPLPGYVPPREAPETNPERAKLYPLNIISPKSHGFLNSCYANEQHKIKGQGEQFVMISPGDAAKRIDSRRRSGAGLQRPRRFRRRGKRHRRRPRRRRRGDARLLAVAQPLRRIGELDLLGRVVRPRPRADLLRQSGRGSARELIA